MTSNETSPGCIQFLQINLNRMDIAYQSALQHALESKADIVLVQEPYCPKNHRTAGFISLQHTAFHTITPQPSDLASIAERPRVLTYIRKAAGVEFTPRYDLFLKYRKVQKSE